MYPPQIAGSGTGFVLTFRKYSDIPETAQRIELWTSTTELEPKITRGFPSQIVSLYVDSELICVASACVGTDIYTVLNYRLEITYSFGQSYFVDDPFYMFHSDFSNYLQVWLFNVIVETISNT
jgi:hypothetical protein